MHTRSVRRERLALRAGIDSTGMVDAEETGEDLPAWSLPAGASRLALAHDWPGGVTREWAFGGSRGAGVRVCVIDSGVDAHPTRRRGAVGGGRGARQAAGCASSPTIAATCAATATRAQASSARSRPDCEIHSVRVLGAGFSGNGELLRRRAAPRGA